MQESDLHDLSDDADYAASQQQGATSILQGGSIARSSSSDSDGAEVVYLKDNVTIHPSQFAPERISGRLKLIKQGPSLFMSWIPYKGQNSNARLSEKDRNLYTIRAVPFTEVRSIHRHTPTLGWQYIIVVLSSGLAFPPLYFYNGGVREFLATIKEHVFTVRSAEDANVFLVNNFDDRLQRTLSSLELPRVVSVANGLSTSISVSSSAADENQHKSDGDCHDGISSTSHYTGSQRHKGHDPARDFSINVLEKFSLVTRFARETTSQLFRENFNNGFSYNEGGHGYESPPLHPSKESIDAHNISDETANASDEIAVPTDPLEFDKLSLVWGNPREPPLGSEEWATFFDSEGRVMNSKALKKRIFYGGIEGSLRKEVWKFLLGYYLYESTYAERENLVAMKRSKYETIKYRWQSISSDEAKRFNKFRERKMRIEKDVVRTDRLIPFFDGDDNPNVNLLHDILLTYSFYNFNLGYCQGMSDLLSPILFVMKDESESFWCFAALMELLGPNFDRDQTGMHSQLFALAKLVELLDTPLHNYFRHKDCLNYFFCFRWILLQFKREFEYEGVMRLWEVLWTHHLSEHLHLYACVAILKRHRRKIMGEEMDFDAVLKFINGLSGHIDVDAMVRDAEALCICAGENGVVRIPPGTPPSLPVESGLI